MRLGVDLHILTKYARNSGSISFNRNYIIQINSICTTKMRCGGVFYRNTKYCKVVGARTGELWGFTTASDRQRLEGFLRRGCRQNLYSTDKPSITQTVEEADENLFNSIRYNPSHLLHQLLPRRTESSYSLRFQAPQLWTLSYPRWQKFYWPSINPSINSLITEMSKHTSTCEKHKAVKYT